MNKRVDGKSELIVFLLDKAKTYIASFKYELLEDYSNKKRELITLFDNEMWLIFVSKINVLPKIKIRIEFRIYNCFNVFGELQQSPI